MLDITQSPIALYISFPMDNYVAIYICNTFNVLLMICGHCVVYPHTMMTSSNGNIFRVIGHLCGEFTGLRWIPHTKASDAELPLICAFIYKPLSKAGDFRHYRAHYDVIVMTNKRWTPQYWACLNGILLRWLIKCIMSSWYEQTSQISSWLDWLIGVRGGYLLHGKGSRIDSLWPSDVIYMYRSGSTLAQ